jgi:hypothetical protein
MLSRLFFRSGLTERYRGLREVLELWANSEGQKAEGKTILVKPNCVSATVRPRFYPRRGRSRDLGSPLPAST